MLGANVGTTLIVQVLSLTSPPPPRRWSLSAWSCSAVAGVAQARPRAHRDRPRPRAAGAARDAGAAGADGAGPGLRLIAGVLANQPVLALVLGALLAWAAHSSATVVLLVMSLAARLVLPLHAALAMTLGANLGTAINPCLEGGAGDDREALRLPLGNLGLPHHQLRVRAARARPGRAVLRRPGAQSGARGRRLPHPVQPRRRGWCSCRCCRRTRRCCGACCRRARNPPIRRGPPTSIPTRAPTRWSRSGRRRANRCASPTCWSRCWSACATRFARPTASASARPAGSTTCSTRSTRR